MTIRVNQKLEDAYNTAILLARGKNQHLTVEKGRLALRKKLPSLPKRREVAELVSSLLSRVKVGSGPLTEKNVRTFVFEKIFPLHPSLYEVAALHRNPALKALIAKRALELKPEVDRDLNIVRCVERIKGLEKRIRIARLKYLNPLRKRERLG